mgnify:CR=1 FL=1
MNYDDEFQPGDVISVRFAGVLRHYGVVTYGGRVISNTRRDGGVVSQSLEEFSAGRPIQHHRDLGGDNPYLSHARASRRLGQDYSLTGSNCVHLVRHANGRKPTTTQIARATLETFRDMLGSRRR